MIDVLEYQKLQTECFLNKSLAFEFFKLNDNIIGKRVRIEKFLCLNSRLNIGIQTNNFASSLFVFRP